MAFPTKTLRIGSLSALAFLVGLGALWQQGLSPLNPSRASAPTPADSAARVERSELVASGTGATTDEGSMWKVGATRTYSLDFGSRLEADASTPSAWFAVVGSASIKLTRVATPEAVGNAHLYLQGELSSLSVVLENEQMSGQDVESRIEKDLDKPFFIRVSEGGQIDALGTHSGVTGMGYNVLRSAVAALQFVEPSGAGASWNDWEAQESDQNGVYKARYRKKGGGVFEKTKLSYSYAVSANLAAGPSAQPPTVQSVTQLLWSEGRLRKAQLTENMLQPLGEKQAFKTKMHINLELVNTGQEPSRTLDTRGIRFLPLFHSKSGEASAEAEQKHKRELVAGATFDELRGELSKLGDTVDNRDARWKLAERLTALYELSPASIPSAIKELRSAPPSADRELLLAAISDADLPEARAALAELARDRAADPALRDSVLVHLGVNEKASAEGLEALTQVAADSSDTAVHGTATLALGSAAHAGARTEGTEPAAEQAVRNLTDGYQRATSPKEQRLYLEALGNAGSQDALDTIRSALSSPDPTVRAAAAGSLRRISGPDADELLATTLRNDPAPAVRGAAIQALEGRALGEPVLAALGEGLRSEQEGAVRLQMIALLGPLSKSLPPARALLGWSASNDPVEKLRNIARKALQDT